MTLIPFNDTNREVEMNVVLKLFGERTEYLSPITNPFNKASIEGISLHVTKNTLINDSSYSCWGYVEFKNGSTGGKQSFKADTFDELAAQVKAFIEHL
jgi:hypothetical protein